jgi:hypothetical protein
MKPVYAITSNTEISYGETFGFLRYTIYILENNSCSKIYHVKKKFLFRSFNTKLCLFHITVTWGRNRRDIFVPFFSFIILQILSRIFEFSKIRYFNIKQKSFLYNEWKFERRKWNLISSYGRGKSPRFSDYNQIEFFFKISPILFIT